MWLPDFDWTFFPLPEPLKLTVLPSRGVEQTPSGAPLCTGFHLRWTYPPELWWPAGGFVVDRRLTSEGEFREPGPWETVATLHPPTHSRTRAEALVEARRRHNESLAGTIAPLRGVNITWLVDVLRAGGGLINTGRVAIDRSQLLVLAALDPDIARILGVGYIDAAVPPGAAVDYRVTGHWGTAEWPWHTRRITSVSDAAGIGDDMAIHTVRGMRDDAGGANHIDLIGPANLPLDIELFAETRALSLDIRSTLTADWRVVATSAAGREVPVTVAVESDRLNIVSGVAPCSSVSISQASWSPASWTLSAIRRRRRSGPIGNPVTQVVTAPFVAPAMALIYPERIRAEGDSGPPHAGPRLTRPPVATKIDLHTGETPDDPNIAPLVLVERVGQPLP